MRNLVLTYLALMLLAAASWALASFGTGTLLALAIAAAKAMLIALVFMELSRAHAVDRLIATIAVGFVILLCAGAVADVHFR